jgi:YihY family inner membrane protein
MLSRPVNSRLDDLMSWFAASVLVTAGVIYTLKFRDVRHKPAPAAVPPRATPAQEPLTLQEFRAAERGRGRRARKPLQLPWRGWKDVLVRTYREIQDDRLLALAAGVAFYSLVALFPAIAAGVSSYALFANAATISNHLSIAADIVPASTLDIMGTEISRIAAKSDGRLTFGFLLGLGIALWSANAGMKAIFDALNIIYDEDEKRGLVWLNVVSLFFTISAIAGAGLAIALVVVFPLALAAFGVTSSDHPIIGYLRWPLMFVLIILGLSVLYRYGPSRRWARWRWISVGSVFAALAWLLPVLLVPRQFRQLQRHLRSAGRGGRLDDVDVAFNYRGAGRRRAQFRARASDRARFDRGAGKAARHPRRRHGRYGWGCRDIERDSRNVGLAAAARARPSPARGAGTLQGRRVWGRREEFLGGWSKALPSLNTGSL